MTPPDRSRKRNHFIFIVALVLAAIIVAGAIFDRKTRPVLISGPMVQIPEPDKLAVIWNTKAFFHHGAVRLAGPDGFKIVSPARIREDGGYEATFKGLAPIGKYTYTVLSYAFLGREIELTEPLPVYMPAPRGRPMRFAALGDSGMGNHAQAALAEQITRSHPDVVIHVGDLVYPSGAREDYLIHFFQPNEALIRFAPFMPVLGNHDAFTENGKPLLDTFDLPRNGPPGIEPGRCYWFDFGDARFVALDSNRVGNVKGAVLTKKRMKTVIAPWVRDVLTNCDARWKFVYFHHPFYTGSTHPAKGGAYMKEAYVDIFENCGVDIVFVGHNHLYERTAPIRGDRIVEDGSGVVYITTGAGGAPRYPEDLPPPDYIRVYYDQELSFTQVDLTGNRLELMQINPQGNILDHYVLEKPPAAASQPAPRDSKPE
ncbi:MAG TPA: metallophosphoesterase [Phycisphaerae bacterium]|nr:metallophosphoesterase [Phycisphaerae bacterium]